MRNFVMTNLAQVAQEQQAVVVQFPKHGRQVMSKKDVSYTRTPNYLVDENYVARMTGNALKCYTIINRFTEGFSRSNWAIDSTFLLEKTGIKKPHTAYDAVKQLEEFGLVSVYREDGRTNKFTITHPCLKMAVVPNLGSAEKRHEGDAEKGHTPTAEKRHTKKESIQKENIKESIYVQNAHEQAQIEQAIADQKALVESQQAEAKLEAERLEKLKAENQAKAQAKAELQKTLSENFKIFWSAYPKKSGKKTAEEKFNRIDFQKHPFEQILSVLEKQKQSNEWLKNNGQFVPMPQTWIFNERWNDEITAPVQPVHSDVNAYWADQLQAQSNAVPAYVAPMVLGEEFS